MLSALHSSCSMSGEAENPVTHLQPSSDCSIMGIVPIFWVFTPLPLCQSKGAQCLKGGEEYLDSPPFPRSIS